MVLLSPALNGRRKVRRRLPAGSGTVTAAAMAADVAVWFAATALAWMGRFDFDAARPNWVTLGCLAVFLAGAQLVIGAVVSLYQGAFPVGSFDELRALAAATSVSALAANVVVAALPMGVPRSVPFLAWPIALVSMASVRCVKRVIAQAEAAPGRDAAPLLIFGAGWVGSALALRMLRDSSSRFRPVGFLDEDPEKRQLQLHGVRVLGRLSDLPRIAARTGATHVVVAIKKVDSALIRQVSAAAEEAGLRCLVLPSLDEMLSDSQVRLSALREVNVEDLIGRRAIDTDVRSIARYVTGRRVLVTGAGGSIGSELCRQLARFGPSELVMLDRDESALHAVELSIYGRSLLDSPRTALVDIRDAVSVGTVFAEHRPHVVFHAAALKHLPLLERFPLEAVKTNVYGTLNVLEAAVATGVEHFVNISTDKAAKPCSALGHSKRLAERLTAWHALRNDGTRFLSVRFGNVLGSRGSVLHAFAAQIEGGGPVTVTDPEVTRYFMTVAEACQLVVQAGAIGRPGEALVLDMGTPVRIVDVARRMIDRSGKDVSIVFTGLRDGEKLHEDLFADRETGQRPIHPLISHVPVPPLAPDAIEQQDWTRRSRAGARIDALPPLVGVLQMQAS